MPLLGFFNKRTTSSADSLDGDYVLPDKAIYNLNSNSKRKLPFRRKQVLPTSDSAHDLPPPPPILAAHNHSALSLPNNSPSPSTDAPKSPKKSPALFPWVRERTRSKPPTPPPPMPPPDDSFNLKAFRHVRPDPPPPDDSVLPPPRPRIKVDGTRVASDSSQRISVAAFREAQARSRANSPVTSFRPTSTTDTVRVDAGRRRSSTLSVLSASDCPLPNSIPVPRSDPSASDSSSSASSDSDDDQDVDSDGQPIPKQNPKRTITRRVPSSPPTPSDPPSHIRQQPNSAPSLHHSDQFPTTRQRASVSTSALIPNAAARSASALATTTPSHVLPRLSSPKQKDDSDHSTDHSDSCEDMPLVDLVAPRRPASSASNHPRMPSKPLIDINTLTGSPRFLTPILRHEHSLKNTKGKEPDIEKDQPFSIPPALALASPPPISPPSSPSPASSHRLSPDEPVSPKPKAPDNDDDLVNAIRLVGALDKEHQQLSETVPSLKPHPSDQIVPTPIRAREPPTSFSVLSRPAQRQSTTETSPSLSPTSQTRSSISSPTPDMGARQRATSMINSPTHKDKSDATSIVSTSQSTTSRSSSRIPPVPLIHSIPDSPSVTGRFRSEPRTSAIITPQSRLQPPPTTPNKMLSQGLPQRPFPSNSSLAGESPAGSSTGDSSSGRAPFTPRDGSDLGIRPKGDTSDVDSTLKARGHAKKSSVTFEDQPFRERGKIDLTNEHRTRERRRSEAKAALELGKIVNGPGPLGNESYEDVGVRGQNSTINVTRENTSHGMMQPGWPTWQQQMPTGMGPMVLPQFNNDPAFFAAHQRALLMAKQAYQMAVAQHAMQMAGEEWERSSNAGFASGGSVYGGGSGGSVYGGGSGGSVYGGMGMMGMPSIGMLMPHNPWASRSSVAFPSSGSVYGGMSSEYGGGGGGGWGTRSVYGDSFGSSPSARPSGGPNTNGSASAYGGVSRPRAQTGILPPSSSSRPSGVAKDQAPAAQRGRAAPPSSWKSGR